MMMLLIIQGLLAIFMEEVLTSKGYVNFMKTCKFKEEGPKILAGEVLLS